MKLPLTLFLFLLVTGCGASGEGTTEDRNPSDNTTIGEDTAAGEDSAAGQDAMAAKDLENADTEACVPACSGKQCGTDGCGGKCGTCSGTKPVCNASFQCVSSCTPACSGKECGNDGCGGKCGTCSGTKPVCNSSNLCVASCTPKCTGKVCGSDGCGGKCGTCPTGKTCSTDQKSCTAPACVPACSGRQCGPDGCGATCGTCASGSVCNDGTGKCSVVAGNSVEGWLKYEIRWPKFNDKNQIVLEDVSELDGAGVLAIVVDSKGETLGFAQVGEQGHFVVPVGYKPSGTEQLYFMTTWSPSLENYNPKLMVAYPDGEAGKAEANVPSTAWAWAFDVPAGGAVGSLLLTEEYGSGAMYMYAYMLSAMQLVAYDLLSGQADNLVSLAVLWAPGIEWDCGACFYGGGSQNINDVQLDQSIYMPGSDSGWSYSVALHEFGHYVLANYSRDDSPGGNHNFGELLAPAFAWSEGWASFFFTMTMSRWFGEAVTLYWDIQDNSSFWIDYGSESASWGAMKPATIAGGLQQKLGEDWVTTMIFNLWDGSDVADVGIADGIALTAQAVMGAVGSERMLCGDRAAAGADFVDFLDAVTCAAPSTVTAIKDAVSKKLGFPWDGAKTCDTCAGAPLAPMALTVQGAPEGGAVRLVASLNVGGRVRGPVVLELQLPDGAVLLEGRERELLGQVEPGTRLERTYVVLGLTAPCRLTASSSDASSGASSSAVWPEPARIRTAAPRLAQVRPFRVMGTTISKAVVVSGPDQTHKSK